MSGSLNNKVQAQSLVDAVAERIETAIVSGTLEPGSKLSEQALAKSLGVSRGPLREAIRRLEGRKLLERTPNIGVRVAALSVKDISEILQVHEALQGMACALAAKNMEDAEIASLKEAVAQHKKRLSGSKAAKGQGKGTEDVDLDLDFHFRIIMGSRNKRLTQLLVEDLSYLLWGYRYRPSVMRGRGVKTIQEHQEIVAALARRDAVGAEQKMRQHIRNGRLNMEETFKALGVESGEAGDATNSTTVKVGRAKDLVRVLSPATDRKASDGAESRSVSPRARRSASRER